MPANQPSGEELISASLRSTGVLNHVAQLAQQDLAANASETADKIKQSATPVLSSIDDAMQQQIKQQVMETTAARKATEPFDLPAESVQRAEVGHQIFESALAHTKHAQELSAKTWGRNLGSKLWGMITGDTEAQAQWEANQDIQRLEGLQRAYQQQVAATEAAKTAAISQIHTTQEYSDTVTAIQKDKAVIDRQAFETLNAEKVVEVTAKGTNAKANQAQLEGEQFRLQLAAAAEQRQKIAAGKDDELRDLQLKQHRIQLQALVDSQSGIDATIPKLSSMLGTDAATTRARFLQLDTEDKAKVMAFATGASPYDLSLNPILSKFSPRVTEVNGATIMSTQNQALVQLQAKTAQDTLSSMLDSTGKLDYSSPNLAKAVTELGVGMPYFMKQKADVQQRMLQENANNKVSKFLNTGGSVWAQNISPGQIAAKTPDLAPPKIAPLLITSNNWQEATASVVAALKDKKISVSEASDGLNLFASRLAQQEDKGQQRALLKGSGVKPVSKIMVDIRMPGFFGESAPVPVNLLDKAALHGAILRISVRQNSAQERLDSAGSGLGAF